MKQPRLSLYAIGALATFLVLAALVCVPAALLNAPWWTAGGLGFFIGLVNAQVWMRIYREQMMRYLFEPYEFDCPECRRHIVRFTRLNERDVCMECYAMPGWFNDPALVKVFDPAMLGREGEIGTDGGTRV